MVQVPVQYQSLVVVVVVVVVEVYFVMWPKVSHLQVVAGGMETKILSNSYWDRQQKADSPLLLYCSNTPTVDLLKTDNTKIPIEILPKQITSHLY